MEDLFSFGYVFTMVNVHRQGLKSTIHGQSIPTAQPPATPLQCCCYYDAVASRDKCSLPCQLQDLSNTARDILPQLETLYGRSSFRKIRSSSNRRLRIFVPSVVPDVFPRSSACTDPGRITLVSFRGLPLAFIIHSDLLTSSLRPSHSELR